MSRAEYPDREKTDEYRRKAIDAGVHAVAAKDAFIRENWERIAGAYMEMAERLERNSR